MRTHLALLLLVVLPLPAVVRAEDEAPSRADVLEALEAWRARAGREAAAERFRAWGDAAVHC